MESGEEEEWSTNSSSREPIGNAVVVVMAKWTCLYVDIEGKVSLHR